MDLAIWKQQLIARIEAVKDVNQLSRVEEVLNTHTDISDEERSAADASIKISLQQVKNGQTIPFEEGLKQVREQLRK